MSYSSQEVINKKQGLIFSICESGESAEQVPWDLIKWTLKPGVEEWLFGSDASKGLCWK